MRFFNTQEISSTSSYVVVKAKENTKVELVKYDKISDSSEEASIKPVKNIDK